MARKPDMDFIVTISDLHVNSTRGLRPPSYTIKGEKCNTHRTIVKHLWRPWLRHWQDVKKRKKELDRGHKVRVICVVNGDAPDRNYHDKEGYELLTPHENEIVDLTEMVLEPAFDVVDLWAFNRGTRAHDGTYGKLTEALAKQVGEHEKVERDEDGDWSHWWIRRTFQGVYAIFAHHPTSRAWVRHTRSYAAQRTAFQYFLGFSQVGDTIPDFLVFAHTHWWADSGTSSSCPVRAFYNPSWQLPTSYIYGKGLFLPEEVGCWWFTCADGKYTEHLWRYLPTVPRAKPM